MIEEAKKIIDAADAVIITAGAGMGVDSGLPDFRGQEGFWRAYPTARELGLSFSQMANPSWFKSDPKLAWAFYGHRLHLYRDTNPHIGFAILQELVQSKNQNYFIYTSNVDGQFQKAGFDEKKIVEVHGSIHFVQCSVHCKGIESAEYIEVAIDMQKFEALSIPLCPRCSEVMRPNILMFGDWTWRQNRTDAQEQRYKKWLKENFSKKIAVIELGAGTNIYTIRLEGERIAKKFPDATLIRINPNDYEIESTNGVSMPYGAKHALELIFKKKQ